MEPKESVIMCFLKVLQKNSKSFFWLFFKFLKKSKSWLDFWMTWLNFSLKNWLSAQVWFQYYFLYQVNTAKSGEFELSRSHLDGAVPVYLSVVLYKSHPLEGSFCPHWPPWQQHLHLSNFKSFIDHHLKRYWRNWMRKNERWKFLNAKIVFLKSSLASSEWLVLEYLIALLNENLEFFCVVLLADQIQSYIGLISGLKPRGFIERFTERCELALKLY